MECNSILIVEDDREIRETLKELLELEGYRTVGAGNGKEALERLPSMPTPCLILLDLMMTLMDGWEFLSEKTGDIRIAPIPVVVVSALQKTESPKGAVGYIRKPIDFDVLLKVVNQYCAVPISSGEESSRG